MSASEFMSICRAAEYIGMSQSWLRQRVFRREIKFLKVGRRVLIPKSTIDELLAQSVVEPRTKAKAGLDSEES